MTVPPARDSGAALAVISAEQVLEAMATGFVFLDARWKIGYLNGAGERIVGRPRAELLQRNFWDEFPGTEGSDFGHYYRLAVESGQPVIFETFYPLLNTWFEVRAVPLDDGLGIYFSDVSYRRSLQDAADAKAQQLLLLADVSGALTSTLDTDIAVGRLAELMVPTLADWCVVTVVESDGGLRDLGMSHRDPDRLPDLAAYAAAQLPAMTDAAPIWQVLGTGQPVVAPVIRPEVVERVFPDPGVRALLAALDPTSGIAVPITARGAHLGVLSLWNSGNRPVHSAEEVDLALDVGRRAGLALDNARLYAGERLLSRALQTSLLTPPRAASGCDVAVRYAPAAHEVQVGGDWYDAFCTTAGTSVVTIGDVVGHDTTATATMGQLRGLLRGIAFDADMGPAGILTRLDVVAEGLGVDAMASAIVVSLSAFPAEHAHGAAHTETTMSWSSAGHLPPIVVSGTGEVRVLDQQPDLVLGVDAAAPRTEHREHLRPGDTVLLYTDGLIERRGAHLDWGISELAAALATCATIPLEQLCDRLLADFVGEVNEDDVALVAVRIR